MNIKPILFNTEMVRAILEDCKTVTRRVVKPQPLSETHPTLSVTPPYYPGDILYVRETWQHLYIPDRVYIYKADSDGREERATNWKGEWRPSIHMPRNAARLFLRITDVRVERLQNIDDDGVVAEGLEIGAPFDELWNSTIKPADRTRYSWNANPWVWVIDFQRIRKEGAT